jgi:hypothetical protein
MAEWFKDELNQIWQGQDIKNYPPGSIIYITNHS